MRIFSLEALLLASWSTSIHAQGPDPIADVCRKFGQSAAVVDSRLYSTGGYVNYGGSVTPTSQNFTSSLLYYADLTTQNNYQFPPVYANLSKPSYVPSAIGAVFWPDTVNKLIYLWGGEYNWSTSPPAAQRLWFYDVLYDTWNLTSAPVNGIQSASFGASAVDQVKGVAYYYGGWTSNATTLGHQGNPVAQQGLVTYDMTKDLWNNVSFIDSTPRAEGVMFYLPVSDSGMLVYFGGIQQTSNGSFTGSPMNEIHIFDIASQKFYMQTTSGTAPPMRRRFCGGAAWAQDRSSYNIYFYGGAVPPDQQGMGFNDVWILSIPSFTWTNYYNGTGYEHHSASCSVVNGAQMIITGGYFPNSSITGCDSPLTAAQHNLDLGSQNVIGAQWYQFLPNVTSYRVPPNLTEVIGGSPTGGASVVTPTSGFGDSDLAVYMTRLAPLTGRTATRDVHVTSTPGLMPDGASPSQVNTGAIAGGVVGGVVGLALLLLLVWLCLRRRRRNRVNSSTRRDVSRHHKSMPIAEMPAESAMAEAPGSSPPSYNHHIMSTATTPSTTRADADHDPFKSSPVQNRSDWPLPRQVPAQDIHQPRPVSHQQHMTPTSPAMHQYYPPPPTPQQHETPLTMPYELSSGGSSPHSRSPRHASDPSNTIREE